MAATHCSRDNSASKLIKSQQIITHSDMVCNNVAVMNKVVLCCIQGALALLPSLYDDSDDCSEDGSSICQSDTAIKTDTLSDHVQVNSFDISDDSTTDHHENNTDNGNKITFNTDCSKDDDFGKETGSETVCTSDTDCETVLTSDTDSEIVCSSDTCSESDIESKHQNDFVRIADHIENYKFNFTGFAKYLESIAGGNRNKDTSKAIVRDVKLFFQLTPNTFKSDIDILFNKANLESYFQKLLSERQYKPTTLSEKIRRMKQAIKYVIHTEDSMMTNKELFVKGSRLLELLTQWCLSLSKAIALQRQQHSLMITDQLPLVLDPQEFLDNKKVSSKRCSF